MVETLYVLDTCIFLKELKQVGMLVKALKRGRLDKKEIRGKIIVPETVLEEIRNMHGGLSAKKGKNKKEKKLWHQARKARTFLDEELVRNDSGHVIKVERLTNFNYRIMEVLRTDPLLRKQKSPGERDLEILSTAIATRERGRLILLVTWDGGLKELAKKNRVYVKGSLRSLWGFYRTLYRFQIRLKLKKKNGKR